MDKITLITPGGTQEVTPYAAHLCSWKNSKGEDLLFMSSQAIFQPPKAIRGGVPVCFPQFADFGPLGQHGFARNSHFEVVDSDGCSVTLLLRHDGEQHAAFPHAFELRVRIALCDESFLQSLEVRNTGAQPMPFTCALHTYYRVSDIGNVVVEGLQGVDYLDSAAGRVKKTEEQAAISIGQEVDRIYLGAPDSIKIRDAGNGRCIEVRKHGLPDAVLWNPWAAKARALPDLGDEEYRQMVCLEPAAAASGPMVLQPGETWTGSQSVYVTCA